MALEAAEEAEQADECDSEGGPEDVDSLLNEPLSNEQYLSDIEEDKNYIEEVKEKGIEY